MPTQLTLAERLKIARLRSGFDQIELAQRIGVSRQQVSKWENAKSTPDFLEVLRLARVTNTPLDELVDVIDLTESAPESTAGVDGLWSGWTAFSESDGLFPASIDGRVGDLAQELCGV